MANTEGPGGPPPAAWVWSHYRGVVANAQTSAHEGGDHAGDHAGAHSYAHDAAEAQTPAAAPAEGKNPTLIGAGVAAAVLVIAGLTWLFTSQPASSPAPAEPVPAANENAPVKNEAAPPADATAPAAPAAATPPTAAPETPKASAPAAHDRAKKKKH